MVELSISCTCTPPQVFKILYPILGVNFGAAVIVIVSVVKQAPLVTFAQ